MTAPLPKNLPDGVEIETWDLGSRHRFAYLADLPLGSHVHFSENVSNSLRTSVCRLNKIKQKTDPTFYLTIRKVSEIDPKGIGFRVIRQDREITP